MLIKSVPRSNATTALELLEDVKQVILDEPRRANMNYHLNTKASFYKNPPSCGTVGCFVGWVCVLAGREDRDVVLIAGQQNPPAARAE
jgi:hypothetical protein